MKDYGRCLFGVFLAAGFLFVGCSEDPSKPQDQGRDCGALELTELTAVLQEALPAGWSVSTNMFCGDEGNAKGEINLEISRVEKVSFPEEPVINACEPFEEDEDDSIEPYSFYLNLHKTKYLTPTEYKVIRDHNDGIGKRCREFTKSLMDVPRHGKARAFGDMSPSMYFPKNEVQSNRVSEFSTFYKENERTFLPQDFHYKKMAFIFYDGRHRLLIDDDSFNAECEDVINTIKTIMKEYGRRTNKSILRAEARNSL